MKNDKSQNISLSKSKVKFDFSTVRTRVIPILKGIEVKMYPAKLARFKVQRFQTSRRILRMNKRIQIEFGEEVAEQRGWQGA